MRYALTLALVLFSGFALAGDKDVNVINEPTVNIGNEPTVNIGNAPDVNVTNDASNPVSVTVGNSVLEPIPVVHTDAEEAFAREPFFFRIEKSGGGIGVDYTVPADQILVIETVNIEAYSISCSPGDLGSRQTTRIRPQGITYVNGPAINLIIVPLVQTGRCGTSGNVTMSASLTTRMYALPNDELMVSNASDASQSVITFTGYLVPSDSPSLAP